MRWEDNAFELFDVPRWVEISLLAILVCIIFRLFKGTRGAAIFSGLFMLLGMLYAIIGLSRSDVLDLPQLTVYIALVAVIIFQPEIRRVLSRLGRQPWRNSNIFSQKNLAEPILEAVKILSSRKIGALIAIEQKIGTRAIQDTGTVIHARLSSELLSTLFFSNTPLHDGGVIISKDHLCAAGCLFPLSQKKELSKMLGTRHRAAIGLTEETDAIVIVVSEETGTVSLAYQGRLRQGLEQERLRRILYSMLYREHRGWGHFRENIWTRKGT